MNQPFKQHIYYEYDKSLIWSHSYFAAKVVCGETLYFVECGCTGWCQLLKWFIYHIAHHFGKNSSTTLPVCFIKVKINCICSLDYEIRLCEGEVQLILIVVWNEISYEFPGEQAVALFDDIFWFKPDFCKVRSGNLILLYRVWGKKLPKRCKVSYMYNCIWYHQ